MMRQIIVITDGCSNTGMSPVAAAAHAYAEGIVVNVIGILDQGDLGEKGAEEVAEIARAGGGMSRIVQTRLLSQTVQMVTRQTAACTIRQTVQEELKKMMPDKLAGGSSHLTIELLPPHHREKVVEMIDELVESASLRVIVLIDTSASMKSKMQPIREAVHDLGLSMQARQGFSEFAVYRFPGSGAGEQAAEKLVDWTNQLAKTKELFYNLEMKGTTPTGPALLEAVKDILFEDCKAEVNGVRRGIAQTRGGLLNDYIL